MRSIIFAKKNLARKKIKPFFRQVSITDIGAEGKSLARIDDKVVFTTYAVPGDVVDLQVTSSKRRYMEARVVRYHEYSTLRQDPFCSHFGVCGGCKWQNLPYEHQLMFKQKQVEDQLTRIGKIPLPVISPILGSSQTEFYRNKLEFTFSNRRWLTQDELDSGAEIKNHNALGFHIPGLFDKVVPITKCWLQPEPSNSIRNFIATYAEAHHLTFFDIRAQKGFLRTLIIRTSSNGEVMVIVSFFHEEKTQIEALLAALHQQFPEITSLLYVINGKGNDTITDQEILVYAGRDHIWEEMEGLRFKIGPKSFYQTNAAQAYELYKVAREFAGLTGKELVYDLYTGTGTIANFVAAKARKVIGMEYVSEAIEDAQSNAQENGISNAAFFAGDIKALLNQSFFELHGIPDVMICDPPRAGMHEDVINAMLSATPAKIVYVSCNPATQARDIALLAGSYKVSRVQPVDMFPHTHHVENVVLLEKHV